ncbi:benzoate-CoA ligase family protein [Aromatoleum toluvorans]|uniref:Benzoate-CoA ligase family protein n=1 Tax=Aromatoleum toluvorans TaxID=92002 RepID=A0ABX1PVP9_9RHOO|nr:benzoate-CoA ligase family protein [Aromatoleum toluvorans]NMG42705.1 benzoate-CoA ligase family protein [Aromatoleum toluvorans]
MAELSAADQSVSPPRITIPREYNAAHDLIERNLRAGRGGKTAVIDQAGSYTYAQLAERVDRFAHALGEMGIRMEERVLLCLLDTVDFPTAFLGCIKAGVVPIPVNTLLTASDYTYMLRDSRARGLVVSSALLPAFTSAIEASPFIKNVIVSGGDAGTRGGHLDFAELIASPRPPYEAAQTCCDDPCFWLYSSGSTGAPKGTVHLHSSLIHTAELYAKPILGVTEDDVVFSAAKLFFAYGLGNGLTFPLAAGGTAVLMAERPTPDAVFRVLREHQPTIYCGVPTLYASMLASPALPGREELSIRRCTSAGEALPAEVGKRWTEHFGVEILDGLGSTEMLHIFLSNRSGDVHYGTSGKPVPGYELRLIGDDGAEVAQGEAGELQVRGPTSAALYWNNRTKSRETFIGQWTRSGDKYSQDADGNYVYAGRNDDMLKVGGIYVSPIEVESALITHAAVLEAAVVGKADDDGLIKPLAFVVLKPGRMPAADLADELKLHVKSKLAPYKYPRWLEFVEELPKTATGKIQRFKLRSLSGA